METPHFAKATSDKQKGSVVIIVLVILLIAGGGYLYIRENNILETDTEPAIENEVTENNSENTETLIVETKTDEKSESMIETNKNTTSDEENIIPPVVENKPIVLAQNSCGQILVDNILVTPEKRTSEEIATLACFSKAIKTCSPKLLSVSDGSFYEIIGKKGSDCSISQKAETRQTCDVPMDFIDDLLNYVERGGEKIENLIIPISFLMAFEGGTNSETGEEIKITCY